MRQVLMMAAALSLGVAGVSFAAGDPGPYKLDKKGNCSRRGRQVRQEVHVLRRCCGSALKRRPL